MDGGRGRAGGPGEERAPASGAGAAPIPPPPDGRAVPPPDPPRGGGAPDREREWSRAHGTALESAGTLGRAVRGYLAVMHLMARPLVAAGVAPTVVTLGAVAVSAASLAPAAAGGRWALLAAVLLALGGLADGLDGQVARESARTTATGALADAVGDRLADAAGPAVLWLLGAPAPLALAAAGAGALQEYARARAQAEGVVGPGAVTVSERPTRVAVAAMFALGCGTYPGAATPWATVGAAVAAVLGLVALVHVVVALVRALPPAGPTGDRSTG